MRLARYLQPRNATNTNRPHHQEDLQMTLNTTLAAVIENVLSNAHRALRHAEIVRKVLESGYVHEGDDSLSLAVQQTLKGLVREGALCRHDNDLTGSREYQSSVLCPA